MYFRKLDKLCKKKPFVAHHFIKCSHSQQQQCGLSSNRRELHALCKQCTEPSVQQESMIPLLEIRSDGLTMISKGAADLTHTNTM